MLTDWNQEESGPAEEPIEDGFDVGMEGGNKDANVPAPRPSFPVVDPIFQVDALERNAARGHGEVTSAAAANNVILVGTSRGWLIRHDFGGEDALEIDLNTTRQNDQTVSKVFLDTGGRHALVSLKSTTGFPAETLYMHARWKKARPLAKLKGILVTSVAWNKQQSNDGNTRDFLIGTSNGQIHEALIEEKDKREKYVKLLYELQESQEPICGIQMEVITTSAGPRYFIMAVTATRLYTFAGAGSLEATFAAAKERTLRFTELPGQLPRSELHFFGQKRTERFAWMAGPGIYHGQINLGAQHSNNEDNYVDNKWLLEYSKLSSDGGDLSVPVSMAVTEFHYLLLFRDTLKAVNRVSQQVVEKDSLGARDEVGLRGMLGLCHDHAEDVIYCYSDSTVYEVTATDEGKDMWRLHLERGEYALALSHARDGLQRDKIYTAQAEVAFTAGDYARAATFYAKVQNMTTFEEVALKFVNVGEQDALRTFLLHKLDHLGKDERAQITMVATWCTELYLDKINRLLLDGQNGTRPPSDGSPGPGEYQHTVQEFRAFLSDCKGVLDEATTVKMLGSYGREEELVLFATLKDHHEAAVQHHIQKGDAKKAIMVLRKPSVSPELWYNFAPALIALDPALTTEAWMAAGANLNPRRLIAALMRYTSGSHVEGDNFAIQYLEFCVWRLQNQDPAIHNLLLSLYAKRPEEAPLLQFLASKFGGGAPGGPDVFYDPKFALRLCLDERKIRSCVFIYGLMEMHEEAVALALQVDLELAKAEADKVEDDEPLRKKLWLRIAKHVIEQERAENGAEGENIQKAIGFLKGTDGLLKIEDILPFFPDFALIDDFKEAICASLEEYNRQIEDLKAEMHEATRGADNIRRDIAALAQRYAVVQRDEPCGVCGKAVLGVFGLGGSRAPSWEAAAAAPFYVFPCEHAFHADCLTQHVMENARSGQRDHIVSLRRQLASLAAQSDGLRSGPASPDKNGAADVNSGGDQQPSIEKVRTALDDAVAGECPFCGERMVQAISEPFIAEDEYELAQSWEIRRDPYPRTTGFVTRVPGTR